MNFLLVEQASCLFIKGLLRMMVQDLSQIRDLAPFSRTGKMPIPQKMNFLLVEQARCLFIKGFKKFNSPTLTLYFQNLICKCGI